MRLEFGPHTIADGRQPGAEKVLDILRTELLAIMQQVGAPTIKHLVPNMVRRTT
jgi:isopentenyl diphosphate isomerase/L-lactate dehydrogenase-like FMN-dependent dehydrogenase